MSVSGTVGSKRIVALAALVSLIMAMCLPLAGCSGGVRPEEELAASLGENLAFDSSCAVYLPDSAVEQIADVLVGEEAEAQLKAGEAVTAEIDLEIDNRFDIYKSGDVSLDDTGKIRDQFDDAYSDAESVVTEDGDANRKKISVECVLTFADEVYTAVISKNGQEDIAEAYEKMKIDAWIYTLEKNEQLWLELFRADEDAIDALKSALAGQYAEEWKDLITIKEINRGEDGAFTAKLVCVNPDAACKSAVDYAVENYSGGTVIEKEISYDETLPVSKIYEDVKGERKYDITFCVKDAKVFLGESAEKYIEIDSNKLFEDIKKAQEKYVVKAETEINKIYSLKPLSKPVILTGDGKKGNEVRLKTGAFKDLLAIVNDVESINAVVFEFIDVSKNTKVLSVFMPANSSFKVYLPNGEYRVNYYIGEKYYDTKYEFNNTLITTGSYEGSMQSLGGYYNSLRIG